MIINKMFHEQDEKNQKYTTREIHQNTIKIRLLQKQAIQGDTGANCTATNLKHIIWDYKRLTNPIPITTYDNEAQDTEVHLTAEGIGTIKIVTNEQTVIKCFVLYTPASTGTIFSPDRYMMDNIKVHRFEHSGDKTGHGYIRFTNDVDQTLATFNMKRSKEGLWYMTNEVLIPPQHKVCKTVIATTSIQCHPVNTIKDYEPLIYNRKTRKDGRMSVRTITWTSKLTKAIQQMEIWHQRLGHPSPGVLTQTKNVVEGIPNIPTDMSMFHCPFCDIAKINV